MNPNPGRPEMFVVGSEFGAESATNRAGELHGSGGTFRSTVPGHLPPVDEVLFLPERKPQ